MIEGIVIFSVLAIFLGLIIWLVAWAREAEEGSESTARLVATGTLLNSLLVGLIVFLILSAAQKYLTEIVAREWSIPMFNAVLATVFVYYWNRPFSFGLLGKVPVIGKAILAYQLSLIRRQFEYHQKETRRLEAMVTRLASS